jgi:glycerol-1-phosphate dehydrogenase [NAD(P)+]
VIIQKNTLKKIKELQKTAIISSGLLYNLAFNKHFQEIIKKYHKILFITDKNLLPKSKKIINYISKKSEIFLLFRPNADNKIIQQIVKKDFDFILAFGSGTINDLAKHSSFIKKTPYSIIASAPSMNGYNSANASITKKKNKKSLKSHLPIKSFFDLKFLAKSPKRLIKSGIGDSLCALTCNFDWLLANFFYGKRYDLEISQILKKNFDSLCNCSYQDPRFMKILCQNLISSGLAMTIFGSSDPASQGEHLISHYIEMKYPKFSKTKFHGEHIAISSLAILEIQEDILKQKSLIFENKKISETEIRDIFFDDIIAKYCLLQIQKKQIDEKKINQKLTKEWCCLRKNLSKNFISVKNMIKIYQKFEIETQDKKKQKIYKEGAANAFLIRDRFTCLDLLTIT